MSSKHTHTHTRTHTHIPVDDANILPHSTIESTVPFQQVKVLNLHKENTNGDDVHAYDDGGIAFGPSAYFIAFRESLWALACWLPEAPATIVNPFLGIMIILL